MDQTNLAMDYITGILNICTILLFIYAGVRRRLFSKKWEGEQKTWYKNFRVMLYLTLIIFSSGSLLGELMNVNIMQKTPFSTIWKSVFDALGIVLCIYAIILFLRNPGATKHSHQ